jgi:hypothetical protein
MSGPGSSSSLDEELAKLEETCRVAGQAISSARSVREAVEAAEVDVPHHLQAVARVKVPSLGRLARARDMRVEEIVRDQLAALRVERSDFVAGREFDRWKATDWHHLRSGYPDLYAKALREANLIVEQKRKNKR